MKRSNSTNLISWLLCIALVVNTNTTWGGSISSAVNELATNGEVDIPESEGDAAVMVPTNSLILTGIMDPNNDLKAIEIYVVNDVADLSVFAIGVANGNGGTDGQEFIFPSDSRSAGDFIYITNDAAEFLTFFGISADYTDADVDFSGDDAVELFEVADPDGDPGVFVVIDTYGVPGTDGSGEDWEYTDTWANRICATGPDATFVLEDWNIAELNVYDGITSNDDEDISGFPLGIYADPCPSGCTDNTACNFDQAAVVDDGNCVFATGCDECSGEIDGSGTVVDNPEVGEACDDGDEGTINDTIQADCSCAGETAINGCTDPMSCNYNIAANNDDGSCDGGVDPDGCDTCSGANDGTGTIVDGDSDGDGVCNEDEVLGCANSTACNFNENATDAAPCVFASGCDFCSGETDGSGVVVDGDADNDGVCNNDEIVGCQDDTACNYNADATDAGSCFFSLGLSTDDLPVSTSGICNTSVLDLTILHDGTPDNSDYTWEVVSNPGGSIVGSLTGDDWDPGSFAGDVTVTFCYTEGSEANCCTEADFTVDAPPQIAFSSSGDMICLGPSVPVDLPMEGFTVVGNDFDGVNWSISSPGCLGVGTSGETVQVTSNLSCAPCDGSLQLTGTVQTSAAICPAASASASFEYSTPPDLDIAMDTEICDNEVLEITINPNGAGALAVSGSGTNPEVGYTDDELPCNANNIELSFGPFDPTEGEDITFILIDNDTGVCPSFQEDITLTVRPGPEVTNWEPIDGYCATTGELELFNSSVTVGNAANGNTIDPDWWSVDNSTGVSNPQINADSDPSQPTITASGNWDEGDTVEILFTIEPEFAVCAALDTITEVVIGQAPTFALAGETSDNESYTLNWCATNEDALFLVAGEILGVEDLTWDFGDAEGSISTDLGGSSIVEDQISDWGSLLDSEGTYTFTATTIFSSTCANNTPFSKTLELQVVESPSASISGPDMLCGNLVEGDLVVSINGLTDGFAGAFGGSGYTLNYDGTCDADPEASSYSDEWPGNTDPFTQGGDGELFLICEEIAAGDANLEIQGFVEFADVLGRCANIEYSHTIDVEPTPSFAADGVVLGHFCRDAGEVVLDPGYSGVDGADPVFVWGVASDDFTFTPDPDNPELTVTINPETTGTIDASDLTITADFSAYCEDVTVAASVVLYPNPGNEIKWLDEDVLVDAPDFFCGQTEVTFGSDGIALPSVEFPLTYEWAVDNPEFLMDDITDNGGDLLTVELTDDIDEINQPGTVLSLNKGQDFVSVGGPNCATFNSINIAIDGIQCDTCGFYEWDANPTDFVDMVLFPCIDMGEFYRWGYQTQDEVFWFDEIDGLTQGENYDLDYFHLSDWKAQPGWPANLMELTEVEVVCQVSLTEEFKCPCFLSHPDFKNLDDPPKADQLLRISPNPGNGLFGMTWPEYLNAASFRVLDLRGRLVSQTTNLKGNFAKLNLQGESDGIYLVQLLNAGGSPLAISKLMLTR